MSDHPYKYFLNGYNPETDALARQALDDVQNGSGLSHEILERAQVRLFRGKPEALKKKLGEIHFDGRRITEDTRRIIEFPYPAEDGSVTRYNCRLFPPLHDKKKDKPRKYQQTKDISPTPYILAEVWSAKGKAHKPLWIVEGEKKTLKLLQHGRLCIGISGVWNFRAGKDAKGDLPESRYLWSDLEGFNWKSRSVYIGFDSDQWINPQVRLALYQLSFTLYAKGAILHFPQWAKAKGIDDYLSVQSNADDALADLETQAKGIEEFLQMDHYSEILDAFFQVKGSSREKDRNFVKILTTKFSMPRKDIEDDLKQRQNIATRKLIDDVPPYFVNADGGVSRLTRGRDGVEVRVDLSNFDAWIVEEIMFTDGQETRHDFVIEGTTNHSPLPRIRVPTTQFHNLNWVTNHYGNRTILEPGQLIRDYFRAYIQKHSNNKGVISREVFGHTGWRKIKNEWAYLMANGALGADNVDVELPHDLTGNGKYCLPKVPDKVDEAIRLIFDRLLDIGKPEIVFPSLAFTFLAPLTTLLDPMPMFSLYYYGERDSLKTTIAVLFLSFFGAHTKIGLSNFDSTINSIMKRAAILKDTLFIVDDWYPSSRQKEAVLKESIGNRLIREVGNRTGRSRLNPDSSEKITLPPQGGIIITGEEIPTIQSTLTRIVAIEFSHRDINIENLQQVQDKAELLCHAMADYILWLKERIPSINKNFHASFQEVRGRVSLENKSRKMPEHTAFLYLAWEWFLTWATERGGITEAVKEGWLDMGFKIFVEVAGRHAERIVDEDPVAFFFETMKSMLLQGIIRIADKMGQDDKTIGNQSGKLVGYHDDKAWYFIPGALWHEVQAHLRLENSQFPMYRRTLYETMERRGMLEIRNKRRVTTRQIGDKSIAVLKIIRGENDPFRFEGKYAEVKDDETAN